MQIKGTTCLSQLLYVQSRGELFTKAIASIKIGRPNFEHEGMAGYIETSYEIEVRDLVAFANVWDTWHTLPEKTRIHLYGMAKGLGGTCP